MPEYPITWNLFLARAAAQFGRGEAAEERFGQFLFNELCDVQPELAEAIRGGQDDPFYSNDRVDAFCERIKRDWPFHDGPAVHSAPSAVE